MWGIAHRMLFYVRSTVEETSPHLGQDSILKATTGGFVDLFKKFWLFFEEVARLRGEMFLEDR